MLSEPEWQSESKQWLLLDGALVGHVVRYVRGQVDNGIEVMNLFWNSPWKELDDIGPVIVEYRNEIFEWAQEQAGYRFGLVFESDAPIQQLFEHWQILVRYPQPASADFLLRAYDPVIWDYFFAASSKTTKLQLMGPMDAIHTYNAVTERWHCYLKDPSSDSAIEPLSELNVSDEQWQGLSDANRHYQATRVMQHADKFFPHLLNSDTQEALKWTMAELERLAKIGVSDDRSAFLYINILGRLGNIWDEENPVHQEFSQALLTSTVPPRERIEQAELRSLNYSKNHELLGSKE